MASSKSSFAIFLCLIFAVLRNVVLEAEARAFFVFGDSLVDNGNNNYLATSARADSPPYGIDYPTHRQAIGEESTLPYLSPYLTGEKLLVGANFASAGVGILNDTGVQFIVGELAKYVTPSNVKL
ncbi:hypothetical protein L2E82_36004 [Cichorium intybus]|uniref:Uncharacterized protein n=1 Tax=Cichorium intybus TaxID=13427 RepID=A0ACB9BQG1_CICIN|nr:hypothetical protein L2E82_36004 [Cichorium intybus]